MHDVHSFRVEGSLRKYLAATSVDETMKIGGWKTESVAKYDIGATSSENVHGNKRKHGQSYSSASDLLPSPEKYVATCARKD